MAGNSVRFTASMDDNVSKKLGLIGQKFDKTFGKGSSASFFGNVGAKGIAVGFGLLSTALSGVTDALGDAVKGAMEDEQSQVRLGAALKASIKGWDGNTEAIEKVITAQMSKGFTDEEQRASLAILVTATNDVAKSQELQAAAMDLARLKGIDLQTATDALIKVDDGHYRVLQSLGIVLDDNATSTDALRAVQLAATGQADAFANTTGGKLLDAQLKVGEAMEKLGYELLPLVSALFTTLADDVIPPLVEGITVIVKTVENLGKAWEVATYWLDKFTGVQHKMIKQGGGSLASQVKGAKENTGGHQQGGHAEGGWVGLRGPEMALVGERGPEYVTPNHKLSGGGDGPWRTGSHGHDIILDGHRVGRAIDERLGRIRALQPTRQAT